MISDQPARIVVEGLEKTFANDRGAVKALDGVSFTVQAGEFVCIVGPSGCGKSTLLKILAGLIRPSAGSVAYAGQVTPGHQQCALVFQEHGLFPWMTVLENVAFGLETKGVKKAERQQRGEALIKRIGLADFSHRYPHELSVGMRQRAALARAILVNPQVLLMDEPYTALDAQSKLVLQEELLRLWKELQQTVVYVTHDIEEAVLLGDRVLVMSGHPGRLKEEIRVPLARPRNLREREHATLREITWHIWRAIEGQVRQDLHIVS